VFDENRYFQAGQDFAVFSLNEVTFGVSICEDIWYPGGPTHYQALLGSAELIVNIAASPYHMGKREARAQMLATRARDNVAVVAFGNMVGGQDELIFDGSSLIVDQDGEVLAEGAPFAEDLVVADVDGDIVSAARLRDPRRRQERVAEEEHMLLVEEVDLGFHEHEQPAPPLPARQVSRCKGVEEVYRALVLGTRDYVRKNQFTKVVVGVSGGIDSALTAAIAAEALGKENVLTVYMPSRYSSSESQRDVVELSQRLGTELLTVPIDDIFSAYLTAMASAFKGREPDEAEENFQARIRGNILMGLSNKFGWLVLATGNKSEASVGYCTLYGDMAGGYAILKDVPKMLVYELAEYVNTTAGRELIPREVITKVPSAELRPNQKDEDSLPPYPLLDRILHAYVEEDNTYEEILAQGLEADTVNRVIAMVDGNEYKRRQAPPGIKISPKAFGKDRRVPVTNRFRSFRANT
jgi:NAD+ synthase (glutamine-hydrolysing)